MSNGIGSGNYGSLYSTKASVFELNPETKSSWQPIGHGLAVAFVATLGNDTNSTGAPSRRDLKIVVSDDSGKAIFEIVLLPKSTFIKLGQRFIQLNDSHGTLYGLGFDTESKLDEFVSTFQTLKRDILSQPVTQEVSPVSQNNDWQSNEQLKYENERLKQVLEESSKNAGVWHNELLNLRTNNVKLTEALQESKAHVQEWERELLSLREENKELQLRIKALESFNQNDNKNDYKKDLQNYKNYADGMQEELKKRDSEIEDLQKSVAELELKAHSAAQNGRIDDPDQCEFDEQQKKKLGVINAKFDAKVQELIGIQKDLAQLVDKLYE